MDSITVILLIFIFLIIDIISKPACFKFYQYIHENKPKHTYIVVNNSIIDKETIFSNKEKIEFIYCSLIKYCVWDIISIMLIIILYIKNSIKYIIKVVKKIIGYIKGTEEYRELQSIPLN
jgi:hypothetical protein